ncbi:putative late blight resistance protein homolog R1A-10, partial [Lycium ferocissimum]|uniref:putative late blight resistance protein homolog R1A-10 n=1 Tax=Lycium ferocissimum TaxID=112874 RepID=UPI002815C152
DLTLDDNELVGVINEEAKKLIKRFVEGPEDLDIVPIVGMVGLGKTTLARKVYDDSQISCEFPNRIWIDVGQSYDKKDILPNILRALKKDSIEENRDKDVNEIAGRCFIVLDEVWGTEVVDPVKNFFAEKKNGHRIMMTTRIENVATSANKDPHYLELLTLDESLKLLQKKVYGRRRCPIVALLRRESIARKCSGLPLAIVAIARELRRCTSPSDWLKVEKNVGHHLLNKDDPKSCLKVVKKSYDHLPREMQECFLYCRAFPQGFDIPARKLIRLWMAEGLIWPSTLEKTAEDYLNNLVDRNLLIVKQRSYDGQVKTCRIHDLLHEFCKEEATRKRSLQDSCEMQPSALLKFLSTKPVAEHVRSFYCYSSEQTRINLSSADIQLFRSAFPLIRVLDIECLKIPFSGGFHRLIHLRYLAISGDFTGLPEFFGKFKCLQTLIVNTSASESILDIKADIWSMLKLRHLHSNIPVILPLPPTQTGKDSSLQTLSIVAPESCKRDVISKASKLKKLGIKGNMEVLFGTRGNLEGLNCLENLKLLNDVNHMSRAPHLPPSFFNFLGTLKKLSLSSTRFDWSEAAKLGELEFLEVLKLKENAFTGESWRLETTPFCQLQVLWIDKADLKFWEASKVNFPKLRNLVLKSCENLEAVPYELAGVGSLQEIMLENTQKRRISEKMTQKN